MRRNLLQFLAVQIVRPLGLLVQFAILARVLAVEGFGQFASAYALAIVLSVLSDLGQRHMVFGRFRNARSDRDRGQVLRVGRRYKAFGTLVLIAAVVVTGIVAPGYSSGMLIAVALVAFTAPVSDVSAVALRAASRPIYESLTTLAEQLVLILVLLASRDDQSAQNAMLAFGGVGLLRMGALHLIAARVLRPYSRLVEGGTAQRGIARDALQLTASEFLAVAFVRFPLIMLAGVMAPGPFAVFAGFWPFMIRGQLVLGAVIQAGYRDGASGLGALLSRPVAMFAISAGFGAAVLAGMLVFATPLTTLYLGADYGEHSAFALIAVALMIGIYPEFTLRMLNQFNGRTMVPLTALAIAVAIALIGRFAFALDGATAFVPFAIALAANSAIQLVGSRPNTRGVRS